MLYYVGSDKDYTHLVLDRSISVDDYKNNIRETLTYDFKFHECFNELIDLLVSYKRKINQKYHQNMDVSDIEPLIFFFFDDVDMSSKKSIQILKDILSYFAHPNMVIVISGDYEVFEHSLLNYFLTETKEVTLKMDNEENRKELLFSKGRTEYFLKKVLPPAYRYYIGSYSDDAKMQISYNKESQSRFERMDILQLISYDFGVGFRNNKMSPLPTYLKAFVIPTIKYKNGYDYIIEKDEYTYENNMIYQISDIKINFLYAYLSVFSENMRGFMNAYNYLCKEAKHINQESRTIKEYWNIHKFREFINVLLDSKYTYQKYRQQIERFLTIKDQEKNAISSDAATKLRIDCEELELVVREIMQINKNDKSNNEKITDEEKKEIKALIMLPILLNELFYCIYKEEYSLRYRSISKKLKNILCNVFVNSLNDSIVLLPKELGMRRTLCVFYSVITRMSTRSLARLNMNYNTGYDSANNKKYVVQLYYATILLGNSGANKNRELHETVFSYDEYDQYRKSTYTNLDERLSFEEDIAKHMNGIFRHLDREWLEDKIKFATAIEPTIPKIEYTLRAKQLKDLQNVSTKKLKDSINEVYKIICNKAINEKSFEEHGFEYYDYYLLLLLYDANKEDDRVNINNKEKNISNNKKEEKEEKDEILDKYYINQTFHSKEDIKYIIRDINEELNTINRLITNLEFDFEIYRKRKFFHYFRDELNKRIRNLGDDSITDSKKMIKELKKAIKRFLNKLNDFKMEYEILESRFSDLYADTIPLFYDRLVYELEEFFSDYMLDFEIEDVVDDYILDIYFACVDNDNVGLRENITDLFSNIEARIIDEKINIPAKNKAFKNIFKTLSLLSERYVKINRYEMNEIKDNLEKYIKCYYLYVFILEYTHMKSSDNMKFFKNFKEFVDYGSR